MATQADIDIGETAVTPDPMASALALNWIDLDPRPSFICSDDLALIWANAAGQAELCNEGALELRDGRLQLCEGAGRAAFAAFLARCGPALSTIALPRAGDGGHILLRARQIGVDETSRYIGFHLQRDGDGFRAVYADLDTVFQLTPTEHRVLGELIEGRTADAIARAMNLSIETVRSHIRHIYAKTRVSSREELFCRIGPYRL